MRVQSLLDQAIVSGTSFVTAVLIGRTTSPEQLGLYYLTLSVVLVLYGIHDQLIAGPYIVYSKRHRGRELSTYAGSSWIHNLLVIGATAVVLLIAAVAVSLGGGGMLGAGLWVLVWAGPLLVLREAIRRYAQADLHLVTAILIDGSVAMLQLAGLAVLASFGYLSLSAIFGVMAGACALASLGWFVLRPPRLRFKRDRVASDWRHNWRFSRWALQSYLVSSTMPQVLPWILSIAVSTAATGVLGACATLVGISNVFVLGVANLLTPQAAAAYVSGGVPALRRVLTQATLFLGSILGSVCLVLVVAGEQLAIWIYGTEFTGCGPILVALGLTALANSVGMIVGNGLWAIDEPRANFVADVLYVSATLLATLFLVVPLGVLGAALAALARATTGTVVRTLILVRSLRRRGGEDTTAPCLGEVS